MTRPVTVHSTKQAAAGCRVRCSLQVDVVVDDEGADREESDQCAEDDTEASTFGDPGVALV
jgi:hypothetical protein